MTKTFFNLDQTAAHIAAFDRTTTATMMNHMRIDHGIVFDKKTKAALLVLAHYVRHGQELIDTHKPAHIRVGHTCHVGPSCERFYRDDHAWCEHSSCQEIMMELCEQCSEEAMSTSYDGGMTDPVWCDKHGWTYIVDAGSNSGFAGEGLWWEIWACGDSYAEGGEYHDA